MRRLRVTTDVRVLAVLRCIGEATVEGVYSRIWRWAAASTVAGAVRRLKRANKIVPATVAGVSRRGRVATKYRLAEVA
jgi:hypothetical protein